MNLSRSLFTNRIGFSFDAMVFDAVDSNRLKRPVAYVKSDLCCLDSSGLQTMQQLRGEVQPGSRRSHGAALARENGLIAIGIEAIFFVALDVGRKRRAPYAIDDLVEVAGCFKPNDPTTKVSPFENLSGEFSSSELNTRARQQ